MRVRFSQDWRHVPADRRVTPRYQAGQELTVKREIGEAAVAAGVAVELAPPPRVEGGASEGVTD